MAILDIDLLQLRIPDIRRALVEGTATCLSLCRQHADRIREHDRTGSGLRAVITLNPEAERIAEELDVLLAQGTLLPLHGVPVLIKDNIDTRDMPTSGGVAALSGRRTAGDATVVARLRGAGALILGKTNLSEFARSGSSLSSLGGQTRNPFDPSRTPGGSSGGSAASVAAGFAVAALGTDTGQSVRSPASATGLVGIRPTTGLVSRHGVMPSSRTHDVVGPITRTVDDAASVLAIIAGYDPQDPTTALGVRQAQQPRSAVTPRSDLEDVVLGSIDDFTPDAGRHREVTERYEAGLRVLRQLGATIRPVRLGGTAELLDDFNTVNRHEWREALDAYLEAEPSGGIPRNLREISESGGYHASSEAMINEALDPATSTRSLAYLAALSSRRELQARLSSVMAEGGYTALVYPHQSQLVAEVDADQLGRNGWIASAAGFPAVTIPSPVGQPIDPGVGSVPVGIDLLGMPWSEPDLLSIAALYTSLVTRQLPDLPGGIRDQGRSG